MNLCYADCLQAAMRNNSNGWLVQQALAARV